MAVESDRRWGRLRRVVSPVPVFALVVAITLTHLALVPLEPGVWEIVVFEAVLLVVMVVALEARLPQADIGARFDRILVFVVAFGVLVGGAGLLSWSLLAVWQTALVVGTVCVATAYGLYRYQQLTLGVLEGHDER